MSKGENKSPALIALHISQGGGKAHQDRVDAAFAHRDGDGTDVALDALPIDDRATRRAGSERSSLDDTSAQELD